MSVIEVFCDRCKQVHPHASGDTTLVCTGCGWVRQMDETLLIAALAVASMPPVEDMRDCGWCKEKLPADHHCPAGAVGCTTRQPDQTPCGCCLPCLAAMTADPRYGTPADLDTP